MWLIWGILRWQTHAPKLDFPSFSVSTRIIKYADKVSIAWCNIWLFFLEGSGKGNWKMRNLTKRQSSSVTASLDVRLRCVGWWWCCGCALVGRLVVLSVGSLWAAVQFRAIMLGPRWWISRSASLPSASWSAVWSARAPSGGWVWEAASCIHKPREAVQYVLYIRLGKTPLAHL